MWLLKVRKPILFLENIESGPMWAVERGKSGRSSIWRKVDSPSKSGRSRTIVDDHGSNRTVIRLKVDGLKESKDKSG